MDFLVPHRDRLVILSFTSPFQNNSAQEENFIKHYNRPTFIEEDDELSHTHLIEKFHSGSFDESDYFDTHEKLENERTTLPSIVATAPNNVVYDINKTAATTPSILTNIETNEKQTLAENAGIHTNGNNRKQHARTKNRNNGSAGGRGSNRKHSNANRDRDNASAATRRDKNNRRGDDLREHFETKVNNKLEFDRSNDELTEKGGIKIPPKKYVTKIDTTDELPPDGEYEMNGSAMNRKSTFARDSNIHIVKPAEGTFVPSTPYSTDSKIIEIKPSTIRTSKRLKRSSETIDTRMHIESDRSDEFGDIDDEDIREPRIHVNFENNEQYIENDDDNLLKPAPDAVAAALIDTSVPANVTAIKTTSKQLHGFAGCLQNYLNVKEIGRKIFTLNKISIIAIFP